MMIFRRWKWFLFALLVSGLEVSGQWTTQRIPLRPGWNAVFLFVQPEPADCDAIFSNVSFQVESVRTYNRAFSSVQFVQDPSVLVPEGPDWLMWAPANTEYGFKRNLFTLESGNAYFIKLPTNAPAVVWALSGKPGSASIDWQSDAYNLVGFEVAETNPPTFAQFFAASPEHTNQPIFRMNPRGGWELVRNPASETMRSGEAFWIRMKKYSTYQGPIRVETDQRDGMDFGQLLTEQTLRIYNGATNPVRARITKLAVPTGAVGTNEVVAGDVPLSYFDPLSSNSWLELSGVWVTTNIPPGEVETIRWAVRRADMAAAGPLPPGQQVIYRSLLKITEPGSGSEALVPVQAKGADRTGLWVGSAQANKVNQPGSESDPQTPVVTGGSFPFRVIVHVDSNGQARLLQSVLLMWKDGAYKTNAADGALTLDEPGRYVLVTDDSKIPLFKGSTFRDGEQVGRRLSSPAFGFDQPLSMTNSLGFGQTSNRLSCTVVLDYDDRLNPFKHQYHPDHDNLVDGTTNRWGRDVESYTVTRRIEMAFTREDPESLRMSGWGDNQLGGVWRETITGLRHQALKVEGVFRLHQASRIGVLNDGL